jgi:hypothetical protein
MGKQTSDSAQKGPGLKSGGKAPGIAMAKAPVKGVALPAPKARKE